MKINTSFSRREFLKVIGMGAVSLGVPGCKSILNSSKNKNPSARPNIILIMADDMGYSDIGCYGGEVETPNIDSLADHGIQFTQFYNTARCCPTRASLLTGLYAHQAGIGHMTIENAEAVEDEEAQYFDYGYPGYRGSLNRNCVTIAEALKPAGYHTIMSGKWHVGTFEEMWPVNRGFDQYFGIILGACNFWNPAPDRLLIHNRKPIKPWDGFYTTDVFTDYAIKFISEASKAVASSRLAGRYRKVSRQVQKRLGCNPERTL
ncbi:MAG: sulfatase-like hydrolase/transferase [Planctomycetota bacterium]